MIRERSALGVARSKGCAARKTHQELKRREKCERRSKHKLPIQAPEKMGVRRNKKRWRYAGLKGDRKKGGKAIGGRG